MEGGELEEDAEEVVLARFVGDHSVVPDDEGDRFL